MDSRKKGTLLKIDVLFEFELEKKFTNSDNAAYVYNLLKKKTQYIKLKIMSSSKVLGMCILHQGWI